MDETLPLIQWGFLIEADQGEKMEVHWGVTGTLLEDGKDHRKAGPGWLRERATELGLELLV